MSESDMWRAIRPAIRHLDPIRVENPIHPGTPDVNYAHGWIELKYSDRWPPHGGVLRVRFAPQQRAWLTRRRKANGRAFLLLRVGIEWLLFDGAVAAALLGRASRERLYMVCLARWRHTPRPKEIIPWLI